MASRGPIKWTPKQQEMLRKAVKQYNAKISRELRKNPKLKDYLPERLSVREEKKNIKTWNDLRELTRRASRIMNEGALTPITTSQGVKLTKYEARELELGVKRINAKREREWRAIVEVQQQAGKMPRYQGKVGSIAEMSKRPKKFDLERITKADFPSFRESVKKQAIPSYASARADAYKQNYLRAVEAVDGSRNSALYQYVDGLSASDVEMARLIYPECDIKEVYPDSITTLTSGLDQHFNTLLDYWQRAEGVLRNAREAE